MKTILKIEDVKVKGKLDGEGCLHKNIIIKATLPYSEDDLKFLGEHVEEVVNAEINARQVTIEYGEGSD